MKSSLEYVRSSIATTDHPWHRVLYIGPRHVFPYDFGVGNFPTCFLVGKRISTGQIYPCQNINIFSEDNRNQFSWFLFTQLGIDWSHFKVVRGGCGMPLCTSWNFDPSKYTEAFTPWQLCAAASTMHSKNHVMLFCRNVWLWIQFNRALYFFKHNRRSDRNMRSHYKALGKLGNIVVETLFHVDVFSCFPPWAN